MKIAIDLRSLQSGTISGVENYTINLLENILPLDKTNFYSLFNNAYKNFDDNQFHVVNSRLITKKIPNKLLNLFFKLKLYSLEDFCGKSFQDCFFLPNLNQFHLKTKARLVITVHDLSPFITGDHYDIKRKLWHKFLNVKNMLNRADAIIAVSEYTKIDLIRVLGIKEGKITVIYPGIDTEFFKTKYKIEDLRTIRNKFGLPGKFILFLNTIEPRKNLTNLIKAFEQIKQEDVHLVIAGKKGWKHKAIFKIIKHSPKKDLIHFLGYVNEVDKPLIINLSQALVYPSFYEGFGFQPLEAMACGIPVLASNVTALPEVLKDSALLVNPYNINEIAFGLENILTNDDLRKILIIKGQKNVESYTWQSAAKKTLNLLCKNN